MPSRKEPKASGRRGKSQNAHKIAQHALAIGDDAGFLAKWGVRYYAWNPQTRGAMEGHEVDALLDYINGKGDEQRVREIAEKYARLSDKYDQDKDNYNY